jgi:hypothetical protein
VLQRGALGRVLPTALTTLIGLTHGAGTVQWDGDSGTHLLRVVTDVAN